MLSRLLRKLRSPSREPTADRPSPVHTDDDLRITSMGDTDAPNLFLCFTGIKQAMGGIGAEEFVGTTVKDEFSALFVSDLRRSWFNGFAPEKLVDLVGDRASGRRIVTIGNSMGGYGAIWATRYFDAATAIAFAPQYSVHPAVVPDEHRWAEYRKQIDRWRHESLDGFFGATTRYYTINGTDDRLHWSRFPERPNCEHVLIGASGHDPALAIKRQGAMSGLFDTMLAGRSALEFLQREDVPSREAISDRAAEWPR